MLKRRSEQIQLLVRVADAIVAVVAFFAAFLIRAQGWVGDQTYIGTVDSLTWVLASSLGLHFLTYPYLGFYESLRLKSVRKIAAMVVHAFVIEFFILGSLIFLFQAKETSRYFFGLFLVINYSLILFEKIGARAFLTSIRRRGYNYRQVLLIGSGRTMQKVVSVLSVNKHWGYVPAGILVETEPSDGNAGERELLGIPILGRVCDLEAICRQRTVDEVIFALDQFDSVVLSENAATCERLGVPARFCLGLLGFERSKVTFSSLDSLPMVTFYTTLMTPADAFLKRLVDILVSLVGLLITVMVYPWISWRIRRESPGSVIFKQVRVGENGRLFKCYKFRTMQLDADLKKMALASANQMEGPIFKIDNDPRIFPFGAFLRRTSLDELPQFLNVLRGDMSIVGTRPPTPDEVSQYQTHYRRRLSIRPGITGLWQVSGRSQIRRFEDILKLDLEYIDHWSIWLDVKIIARTIMVTVFRIGAH